MSILTNIKDRLFQRRLAEDTKTPVAGKRKHSPVNLETAKRILVLFPADDDKGRKEVERWKEKMRGPKRQIKLVGYFDKNYGSATFDFTAISVKESTWFGLPKGEMADRYLKEDCDLLLRIGPIDHARMDYLAAAKQADLKVGPYNPERTPIYQLQFDGRSHSGLADQLAAIEAIFSFTNAKLT